MQRQVSGMHIAHDLMHNISVARIFDRGAKPQITCNDVIRNVQRVTFYGTKDERSEAGRLVWHVTKILLKGKDRTTSYSKKFYKYIKIGSRGEQINAT